MTSGPFLDLNGSAQRLRASGPAIAIRTMAEPTAPLAPVATTAFAAQRLPRNTIQTAAQMISDGWKMAGIHGENG